MKNKAILIIGILTLIIAVTFKLVVLKTPDSRLLYTLKKDSFVENIKVSGTYYKTSSDQELAEATASLKQAQNQLIIAKNNKNSLDATMWSKRQTLLNAENAINYKNDNTTNPTTKEDYTDLEKLVIDDNYVQAEKDFRAAEQKYKDADSEISSAYASLNSAKVRFDTVTDSSPVVTLYINEVYASRANVGQKATITFDAQPNSPVTGLITKIDDVGYINNGIVTYETEITLDQIPQFAKKNMTVIAEINLINHDNAMVVPISSLITKNDKVYVLKISEKKEDLVEVQLGIRGLSQVEITTGIEAGSTILANPTSQTI